MMDVGIFCKEARFGINPEKGDFPTHYIWYTYTYTVHKLLITSHSVLHLCFSPDCTITKFLNRILGLEVHKQNSLFQYFSDNFDYLIEKDKKDGKYDMGILGKPSCYFLFNVVPSFKYLLDCNAMCPLPFIHLQIWLLGMMRSPMRLKRCFWLQATHRKARSFSIRSVWIEHVIQCAGSKTLRDTSLSREQNQSH